MVIFENMAAVKYIYSYSYLIAMSVLNCFGFAFERKERCVGDNVDVNWRCVFEKLLHGNLQLFNDRILKISHLSG